MRRVPNHSRVRLTLAKKKGMIASPVEVECGAEPKSLTVTNQAFRPRAASAWLSTTGRHSRSSSVSARLPRRGAGGLLGNRKRSRGTGRLMGSLGLRPARGRGTRPRPRRRLPTPMSEREWTPPHTEPPNRGQKLGGGSGTGWALARSDGHSFSPGCVARITVWLSRRFGLRRTLYTPAWATSSIVD